MGFWSALGSLAGTVGGSLSLTDATGGWSSYSATQSSRKDQMRREINMAQTLAMNGPSWTMEGLRRAGLNPILAAESANSWSGQYGNINAQAPSGGSSASFRSKADAKMLEEQATNIRQDSKLKSEQGKAALMQAEASQVNAKSSAAKAAAEINFIEQQRKRLEAITPGESVWGTVDDVLDNSAKLGTAAGGTALAIKGAYDVMKKKPSGPKVELVIPKPLPEKPVPAVHSGKSVLPVLLDVSKAAGVGAAAGGAVYGTKKLMDWYDKSEDSKKLKDTMHIWSHGNWSR